MKRYNWCEDAKIQKTFSGVELESTASVTQQQGSNIPIPVGTMGDEWIPVNIPYIAY